MKIGVVGLGLMGGSIAKALKACGHIVVGADTDPAVMAAALADGAVNGQGRMETCDVVFVCLNPRDAAAYMLSAAFKKGAVVTDIGGVKRYVSGRVAAPLQERGVYYVGGHPMAGRERGGYANSSADLFVGASYIICKEPGTHQAAADMVARLALDMGCSHVTWSTPDEHDRMIAYTSQLAHVVSSSYVMNPLAKREGFSAGSFLDLTRVAELDATMWAQLFLDNADYLLENIEDLLQRLEQMKKAVETGDEAALRSMLHEGSERKKKISK